MPILIELTIMPEAGANVKSLLPNTPEMKCTLNGHSAEIGLGTSFAKELLDFTLTLSKNIGYGMIDNFIHDQLKNNVSKLWIEGKKTGVNREKIIDVVRIIYIEKHIETPPLILQNETTNQI